MASQSSNLIQADIDLCQGILRQINDRDALSSGSSVISHEQSSAYTSGDSKSVFLNGLTKPPKGTKILNYRKQFLGKQDETSKNGFINSKKELELAGESKMSPQLMYKIKKLAKLNLLGAHASTEGPLGYANKPVSNALNVNSSSGPQETMPFRQENVPDWDKRGRAPDEVIFATLDSNYESVRSHINITSEARIKNLISSLRQLLTEMNVPISDFLQYFETYLNRLISDKSWISITPSTALFMAVSSEDESGLRNKVPGAWFKCDKCKFCYPPGRFSCVVCNMTFQAVVDVFEHNYRAHGKLIMQRFQCELCYSDFGSNPSSLRAHYYATHFCRYSHVECSYGCRNLIVDEGTNTLNEHIYNEHVCRICDDNYSTTLTDHQRQFHSLTGVSSIAQSNPILTGLNFNVHNEYRHWMQQKKLENDDKIEKANAGVTDLAHGRSWERSRSRRSRSRKRSSSRSKYSSRRRSKSPRRRKRSRDRRSGSGNRVGRSRSRHRRSGSRGRRSASGNRKSDSRDWKYRGDKRSRSRESRGSSHRNRSRSRSPPVSDYRNQSSVEYSNQRNAYSFVSQTRSPDPASRQVGRVCKLDVKSEAHIVENDDEEEFDRRLAQINSDPNRRPLGHISYHSSQEDHLQPVSMCMRKETDVYRLPHIMPSEKREWLKCSDCPLEMPPPGTYICSNCDSDFEMPNSLYRHVKNRHNVRIPRNFDCEYCPEVFNSVESWDDHVTMKHICAVHDSDKRDDINIDKGASDKFATFSNSAGSSTKKKVKLSYCTQCEYSEWNGLVSSEPKTGVPVIQHTDCAVPECPLLFHSEDAARNHLMNDKRCAKNRRDDNLGTKRCFSCPLSMQPIRILCSYCPPELCEYSMEHELLDHLLATHFSRARFTLLPAFRCEFCTTIFEDMQYGLYTAHIVREHGFCSEHKFCDDSLQCENLYPRNWSQVCTASSGHSLY